MLLGHPEEFPDQLGPVAEVLLDELGADDAEERGGGLVGHGLGKEGLAGALKREREKKLNLVFGM